jgi:hypothetical protein
MELVSSRPSANLADFFASFGPTDFLVKQSILPVVAWVKGPDRRWASHGAAAGQQHDGARDGAASDTTSRRRRRAALAGLL